MATAGFCADAAGGVKLPGWLAAALLLAASAAAEEIDGVAAAQKGTGFDFYVLSLSWSPSFCTLQGSQAGGGQCGPDRDLAFVVHGLWPQFERSYPINCESEEPRRVARDLAETMLDIMPSVGLVGHEWRSHGTCTGLGQADYLAAVRAAYDRINLPTSLDRAAGVRYTTPSAIEKAFRDANPGLAGDGITTTCERGLLDEVRICLTKDLQFRPCPEVDQKSCRAPSISLPPSP